MNKNWLVSNSNSRTEFGDGMEEYRLISLSGCPAQRIVQSQLVLLSGGRPGEMYRDTEALSLNPLVKAEVMVSNAVEIYAWQAPVCMGWIGLSPEITNATTPVGRSEARSNKESDVTSCTVTPHCTNNQITLCSLFLIVGHVVHLWLGIIRKGIYLRPINQLKSSGVIDEFLSI